MTKLTDTETITPEELAAAEAPVMTPSRWAIHRHLYDWVVSFAHKPYGTWALGILSFMESSFFPIPPDVLLGPMCLGKRSRSWWFATVTTVTSVLGAFLGYAIGMAAIGLALKIPGIRMGPDDGSVTGTINWLAREFDVRGSVYVFIAALTPIPFKLLTITAGFAKMNLLVFFIACLIGRAIRFFGVAGVFWLIGPRAVPFIDKYFNLLCIVFSLLLVGGFAVLKFMH